MIKKDRIYEIIGFYIVSGESKTLDTYNLKPETLQRYLRIAKNELGFNGLERSNNLNRIADQYTDKELGAIARGGRIVPGIDKVPIVDFGREKITVGVISDTHLGSAYTDPSLVFQAFDEFDSADIDMLVHSGDVTEGMSNRDGHVYELSHIGYAAQKGHAIEVMEQWDKTPMYMVSGNHDLWFKKSNGADIVDDICNAIPNATYLGEHEGDISLEGKGILKLWHGGDGNSYSISYRLQKIVESITGGEKPSVLVAGHTHKSMYLYDRHIHIYSAGAIQQQTQWMRGKRIASHTGFWIIEMWMNDVGVGKTRGQWFPAYR